MTDDFKPKHCQLQSFINLQYLQLSCWWFFLSRSFSKFKFLIFLNSDVVFVDKMTSNEKLPTTKFYIFSRSTKFIFVVWSFIHLK
jgi:hypothetical protein